MFHDAKLQFEILVLYTKSALIFNRKLPICPCSLIVLWPVWWGSPHWGFACR